MKAYRPEPCHDDRDCCPEIPPLKRLQYFYGQLLSGQDFRDEQSYFREKIKLLNRCLHGYGVICGLVVEPEPRADPCEPEDRRERDELGRRIERLEARRAELEEALEEAGDDEEADDERAELSERLEKVAADLEELERRRDELCPPYRKGEPPARVVIGCGVALDCHGHEIVVRRPHAVDLAAALDPAGRRRLEDGEEATVWLSICYCEQPVEPVRPVRSESCSPPGGCAHAKLEDSYRIHVSLEPPAADERCESCCCTCGEPCLALARIDGFRPGRALEREQVHNHVRRPLGPYDHVTVTGVNWVHSAAYADERVGEILGRDGGGEGLEIRFSRPVLSETVTDGVVDVWVIEGGGGRSADIYHVAGEIAAPAGPTTDRLRFRQTTGESFEAGDRILIQVRCGFLLDECCRPVDGDHLGGRVPLLPDAEGEHPEPGHRECRLPPGGVGPWRSGDGRGGGDFVSWIFIAPPTRSKS